MSIAYSSFNHPLRVPLAAEVHSRPYLRLDVPENISHLAVYAGDAVAAGGNNAVIHHQLLADLCAHFGVAAPGADAKYFFHDFGRFRLKWESHTEFATYTFAQRGEEGSDAQNPFGAMPLSNVPQRWLMGLEAKIMVAAHVLMERSREPVAEFVQRLPRMFEGGLWVGSRVLGEGEVWTDFQIQSDGFTRFVVRDHGLSEQQHGRLAQRLLEIETYRMMAMLGLPRAQAALPVLNRIEADLAALTAQIMDAARADAAERSQQDSDDERALLTNITGLAARLEKMSVENSYRFSASQAYFRLVNARIEELREQRIAGYPTIGEFMERRLSPAQNTCAAVAQRQETMAARIAHTNDLLRTRVGIVQEQQNRRILQSMNARAAQQLRLQQAVEGLSVAAISYYMVGLFGYAGKAAKAAGLPINADIFTGVLVPIVAVGVWLGLRRMHKQMHLHDK